MAASSVVRQNMYFITCSVHQPDVCLIKTFFVECHDINLARTVREVIGTTSCKYLEMNDDKQSEGKELIHIFYTMSYH